MNKIERVNIGGYAFAIDIDAYGKVKDYLDQLSAHYGTSADGKEILEGIEERLAELLFEKCGREGVVTDAMMETAIEVLGNPSQIEDEVTAAEAPAQDIPASTGEKTKKKLYRDTVDKFIGGVCGGLAAYFNMDRAVMRIIWAVMMILAIHLSDVSSLDFLVPFVFLAYIVLWICIPAARTVQQRLEMKGEGSSVEDIRKSVERGERVVENASRNGSGARVWNVIFDIMTGFVGIILILTGASGLMAGTLAFFGENIISVIVTQDEFNSWIDGLPLLQTMMSNALIEVLMGLVYFIPFIGMIYGGVVMLFKLKTPAWKPDLWIFICWMLCAIALALVTGFIATQHILSV